MTDDLNHAQLNDLTWMSTAQAARYTRLSEETLKRAVRAGALQSSQAVTGGWHRYRRDWLDEFMETRGDRPTPRVTDGRAKRAAS